MQLWNEYFCFIPDLDAVYIDVCFVTIIKLNLNVLCTFWSIYIRVCVCIDTHIYMYVITVKMLKKENET